AMSPAPSIVSPARIVTTRLCQPRSVRTGPTQGATRPMPAVASPRHPTNATRRNPARGRVGTTGTTRKSPTRSRPASPDITSILPFEFASPKASGLRALYRDAAGACSCTLGGPTYRRFGEGLELPPAGAPSVGSPDPDRSAPGLRG